MKNKRVKQMICDVLNDKYRLTYQPLIGFAFERTISPVDCSITDYGLHKDCEPFERGTVSLTSQQLRETK